MTDQVFALAMRSIETGNFIPFSAAGLLLFWSWTMSAEQRLQIIREVLHSPAFAVAGWAAFFTSLYFHRRIVTSNEARASSTISRLQSERDLAVKKQLELPLESEHK